METKIYDGVLVFFFSKNSSKLKKFSSEGVSYDKRSCLALVYGKTLEFIYDAKKAEKDQ